MALHVLEWTLEMFGEDGGCCLTILSLARVWQSIRASLKESEVYALTCHIHSMLTWAAAVCCIQKPFFDVGVWYIQYMCVICERDQVIFVWGGKSLCSHFRTGRHGFSWTLSLIYMYAHATFSYHTFPSIGCTFRQWQILTEFTASALAHLRSTVYTHATVFGCTVYKKFIIYTKFKAWGYHLKPFWGDVWCCHLVNRFLQALYPSVMLDSYGWSNLSLSHVQPLVHLLTACSLTSQKVQGINFKIHFCN